MNSMKNWVKSASLVLICLFCLVAFLFRADLYAQMGNLFSKYGNYSNAQKYYAKSYFLGNKNKNFRENYVRLIINTPLTIESQEKLVDIAEDSLQDSASENAKKFLYNLRQEIHNKYPDNYIQQAVYNQKIIHWGKHKITYSLNNTKNVPAELVDSVINAFEEWEKASSGKLKFQKVSENADITVNFISSKTDNVEYGKRYAVAYTLPNISNDKLNRMDMTLNIINLEGNLFSPNQLYNTALHEIFHALGFIGHSLDKDNIMYMTNSNSVHSDEKKELNDADKNTLMLLYKIKPDITNSNELKYEYISYPVVGDSNDVNYAKEEEAKQYIRKAPSLSAGYIDLAQIQVNQKKYSEAVKNLEKAYRLAQNDETRFMSLYNLAVASYLEESYDLALLYVAKAREYNKSEDDLDVLTAEIYLKQKKEDEAIEIYSKLIDKNPDVLNYTISTANIYVKRKEYLKARTVLKKYLKHQPSQKNNPRLKPYGILLF